MKLKLAGAAVALVASVAICALLSEDFAAAKGLSLAKIEGEYVEARTCDVWTGPCFTNGEINLRGDHAIMGWSLKRGNWQGVQLVGLRVAAAIDSEGTLGTRTEGKVRSVVFVDAKASDSQAKALVALARELAPKYLGDIVQVRRAKITYKRVMSEVTLDVHASRNEKSSDGAEVRLKTTMLRPHCDVICGNEEKAFPSLASTVSSRCAKVVTNAYQGGDLGQRWSDPNTRGAMIGSFRL